MSATHEPSIASAAGGKPALVTELTLKLTAFDQRHYRKMIVARDVTIRRVLQKVASLLNLRTALDAGCGVGFYSNTLQQCGLHVCGFDGREENIAEARRRYPQLLFERADIENRNILELGSFDFVLCFGLLYHLENPLLAIRHLRALTRTCLLLESMCIPGEEPSLLLREEPRSDDQSLSDVAWYPSEGSLLKMLYRAGFPQVYRVVPLPNHDDFRDTTDHKRRRTLLLASFVPLDVAGFRLCLEPQETCEPWTKSPLRPLSVPRRVSRFLASPMRRKYLTLALRARRLFPRMPIPLRLSFGSWWLAENGALDHELMYDGFEETELAFVKRLLRPGMTVLDIGAHHGLYTLLASKCVGRKGTVIAFEPSPREFARLAKHVRVNRYSNVLLEPCAIGDRSGEADLFQVDGFRDWGNSLRPPLVPEPTRRIRVPIRTLDDFLGARGITHVDFIKLDAEGGELGILDGAQKLLQTSPRPAILAEVETLRTQPWGYPAREIMHRLALWNYRWFGLTEAATLYSASLNDENYDGNFIALPDERAEEFQRLAAGQLRAVPHTRSHRMDLR